MPKFKEGNRVKLRAAIAELGLDTANVGVVWAIYKTVPPSYEVKFTDNEGIALDVTLAENELLPAIRSTLKKRATVSKAYFPARV